MSFDLKVSLSITPGWLSRESEARAIMSNDNDDWASKFVARLTQKHQSTADANALLMRKQGMIHAEAPYLWDDLREAINKRAKSVNIVVKAKYFTLSPLIQGHSEHTLESAAGHLSLIFNHEVPIVNYRFTHAFKHPAETPKQDNGTMRFDVLHESVCFVSRDGTPLSVDQAAKYFLEMHS